MIKIAICEDEKLFRDRLVISIKHYLEEKGLSYSLDCYEKGEQLLEVNHKQYDILCLDVEIKHGMDGIALAKKLRTEDNRSQMIFLTSHQEEAYRAFEVNAFRYLLKPLKEDLLYKTMDLLIEKIEEIKENNIVLRVGQGFIKLQLQEIFHAETYKRKLKVITLQKEYIVDCTIGDIEEQLGEKNFFRPDKSFIINLEHIKEHNNKTVTMQNGTVIPISRLKLAAFKQRFVGYLRGQEDVGIY